MLEYDFEESVGCWVTMTAHALRRSLAAELVEQGITLRQWEVLAWIALEGEQTQTELAERLGIEAPTLAGILARMERDGWLERFSCDQDRRKKRIRATIKAEEIWNRTVECCHRVRQQATLGISPEELDTFKRLCGQIRTNLSPEMSKLVESETS